MAHRLITVDARGYFTGGGIGRYTRNLVRELAGLPAAGVRLRLLISNRHQPVDLDIPLPPDAEVVVSRAEWLDAGEEDQWLPGEVRGSDLFHSLTGHWLPGQVPSVATLHDLTPVVRPRLVSPEARRMGSRIAETIARAARVIAVSEATAADARAVLGPRLPPLSVIHEAAAPQFYPGVSCGNVLTRFNLLARGFILAVSASNGHKNLVRLVDAYAISQVTAPLMIVGAHRDAAEEVRQAIVRRGLGPRVRLIGRVTDEDLAALYGTCRYFIFPSLYEGFGLPVIEAMACGAAVITSNASSLPEVAGGAAMLVDVTRASSLAAAIRRLENSPGLRGDLRLLGLERAGHFSWTRAARATRDIYRAAVQARAA